MTIYRLTTPVTQTRDHVTIDTITYTPVSGHLQVSFVVHDADGKPLDSGTAVVSPIPAQAQTRLTELVTRLFTYLNNNGLIPSGTEE